MQNNYKNLLNAYEGAYPNTDTHYDIGTIQPCVVRIFNKLTSPILDIGCGDGALVRELAKQGHNIIGIDYAKSACVLSTDKTKPYGNARIIQGDFFDYSFKCKFKSIIDIGMIHNYSSSYYKVYIKKLFNLLHYTGIAHIFVCVNYSRSDESSNKKIVHPFNINLFKEIACIHFTQIEKKNIVFLIKGRKTVKGFHIKLSNTV